jgi:hypothetical protein
MTGFGVGLNAGISDLVSLIASLALVALGLDPVSVLGLA